jgi:hypothetical protein
MAKRKTGKGATVDKAPAVIVKFEIPGYRRVIIQSADGTRYHSDLSSLSRTYCYPKNLTEWKKASVDSYGLALVWRSRFEAHVDQIIGLASKKEPISVSSPHRKKSTE